MKRFISMLTAVLLTVALLPCAGYAADGSLANFTADGEAPVFSDVSPEDWFAPYVRAVSEVGLMIGDGVISLDDLDGFSEDLVEKMRYLMREYE